MLQFTRFLDVLKELEEKYGRKFEIRHCANSGAVLNYPCTHLDMVRPGIALYGHYPGPSRVWLDGRRRPVMGRICMDMRMTGLDGAANVRPGGVAEVFGERLPIEWQAETAGTISYELLCAVATRVPGIYKDA